MLDIFPVPARKTNRVRNLIIVVLVGILVFALASCAPAAHESRLAQAQLTTMSFVGEAVTDSMNIVGRDTVSRTLVRRSPAAQEQALKDNFIKAYRDVGMSQAQAEAMYMALLLSRGGYGFVASGFGGGWGSNAVGTVNQYNGGMPVRCAWPGC